jgi:hypothetical protein
MTTTGRITKQTTILCIGHLSSHVNLKVELLKKEGFINAIPIVFSETTMDEVKQLIKSCPPGSLFIAGGAMEKTYPDESKEFYEFIPREAPSMLIHKVSFADFPAGTVPPVSDEIVAEAAVRVALKMLE